MAVADYKDLHKHIGHRISIVAYRDYNVSCECEDCNEVLFCFDNVVEEPDDSYKTMPTPNSKEGRY